MPPGPSAFHILFPACHILLLQALLEPHSPADFLQQTSLCLNP